MGLGKGMKKGRRHGGGAERGERFRLAGGEYPFDSGFTKLNRFEEIHFIAKLRFCDVFLSTTFGCMSGNLLLVTCHLS
jgi:hypothetical protein